ncbi:MAG TPA: GFA family protein [Aurantimonas sp.]|jgi:hypothetical protein|nr:GFA family protein [Aurantimonas sp.]
MSDEIRPVAMPALPLEGGCQCGALRYAIDAEPIAFYLCHCTECQTQTSSAFGESLRVDPQSVTVTGRFHTTRRISETGRTRLGDFCPECGVRFRHRTEEDPRRVNIKAGTLDDASWLIPAGHIWTSSKQAFVRIDEGELSFPAQPADSGAAIAARWREMVAAGGTRR